MTTHSEDGGECQHQRTHYSQRNGGEHVCSNCGESANDAQLARQVGGQVVTDIADLFADSKCAICGDTGHFIVDDTGPEYVTSPCPECNAPAAKDAEDSVLNACITYVIHGSADFSGMHDGLVAYFKEKVDSLNRRAIPAGLLERVCTWAETFDDRDRRDAAIDELRALLGKENI